VLSGLAGARTYVLTIIYKIEEKLPVIATCHRARSPGYPVKLFNPELFSFAS